MVKKKVFIERVSQQIKENWTRELERDLFGGALLQDVRRCRLGEAVELGLLVAGVEVLAGLLLLVGHALAVVLLLLTGAGASLLSLLCRWLVHTVLELSWPERSKNLLSATCSLRC